MYPFLGLERTLYWPLCHTLSSSYLWFLFSEVTPGASACSSSEMSDASWEGPTNKGGDSLSCTVQQHMRCFAGRKGFILFYIKPVWSKKKDNFETRNRRRWRSGGKETMKASLYNRGHAYSNHIATPHNTLSKKMDSRKPLNCQTKLDSNSAGYEN